MAIIIFLIWLLLNGRFTWDIEMLQIVLFGLFLTVVIYLFIIKFTKWTFEFDKFFIKHIHLFIAYACVLLWNIIQSNINVLILILSKNKVEPKIIKFNVPLENEFLRVILSNSITLTPGTITISCHHDYFVVHCLKGQYMDGFENSALVKLLLKMEGKK